MPVFKVTWQFRGAGGGKWNETFLANKSNSSEAVNPANLLINARLLMLDSAHRLMQIRATQLDAQRVTALKVVNLPGTSPLPSGPDVTGVAAVIYMSTTGGVTRRLWMRGLDDESVQRDVNTGRDTPGAAFGKAFDAWKVLLVAESYGSRRLRPKSTGLLLNNKILEVDGTALDGTSIVQVQTPTNYPFPGRVVIGGASKKSLPALNGHYSILATPVGDKFKIPYQTAGGLIVKGGNAYVRQEDYDTFTVFDANLIQFHHFGTRTTKNDEVGTRGARRAARIRTSL